MSKTEYERIGIALGENNQTSMGQMFGKPCLKTSGNKAFAAFFKECMVFKLGKEQVDQLKEKYPNSESWDPSGKGRPMKDWLQLPTEFNEDWTDLAEKALAFVEGN